MKSVGATMARATFGRLLDDIAHGESVEITKRGRTVAVLKPPALSSGEPAADHAIRQLRLFRHGRNLGGISLRELIDHGSDRG